MRKNRKRKSVNLKRKDRPERLTCNTNRVTTQTAANHLMKMKATGRVVHLLKKKP
jgi:hypothetical protein